MTKKLSLSDWANIAEIVAAIGVIASLIFVGLQLQDNTRATEAATREAINQKDMNFLSLAIDSSVLAVALAKAEQREELTPLERSQLVRQEYVNFIAFEHSYYQYLTGMLVESEWERHRQIAKSVIQGSPFAQEMWRQSRNSFVPEFQDLVDQLLDETTSD